MSYKMTIGERIVEVTDKGGAWLVSTGNLFLASWQSVLCPSTQHLLQVLEQISGAKEGEKQTIPEGCKLLKFEEVESKKDSYTSWRNKNWPMGDKLEEVV
jgi:hypothetical protein